MQSRLLPRTWLAPCLLVFVPPSSTSADENVGASARATERERGLAELPPGWEHRDFDGVLVLWEAGDKRRAADLARQVFLVHGWLEEILSPVRTGGPGRPEGSARLPIVRVHASRMACSRALGRHDRYLDLPEGSLEVSTYYERLCDPDDANKVLNAGIASRWLQDRDPDLAMLLPPWFEVGLESILGGVGHRHGKLRFKRSSAEMMYATLARTEDVQTPARLLLSMSHEQIRSVQGRIWCTTLVRYLLEETRPRHPHPASLLNRYFEVYRAALVEGAPEGGGEIDRRRAHLGSRRIEARSAAMNAVFGEWTERQWTQLDASLADAL